jgi:hypothetical protein
MFRPPQSIPNSVGASGSGGLSPPPSTMLTEAFVAAPTEVVPNPIGTTTDGPTTTANAAEATEAPALYARFTQSTYPDEFKRHYRHNPDVGGAKFSAESHGVRYHPWPLWGALSNEFDRQSLSVFICIHSRGGPLVQSVGGACKSRSTPGLRLHITTFSITHGP